MAKWLGDLTITWLRPRTSSNGRKYTKENISRAVERMQQRIKSADGLPVTMNASHKATLSGDVTKTAAYVKSAWLEDDGRARAKVRVVDTAVGRDVAALAAPDEDGQVGLKGVSIFGRWHGKVRVEDGAETADDLEVTGIDFTHYPGVAGAGVDAADLAEMAAAGLFCESEELEVFVENDVDEVAITETGLPVSPVPGVAEAAKKPYGNVLYADPGYQADGKARYPLDTEKHVRAAWSYINVARNAKKYTPSQLARVKGKIKRAAKKLGIDVQAESEAFIADLEEILEAYASMCISNSGGSVSTSGYTDQSKDLKGLAQRIALAAMAGMATLDPDNDDDVDVESECAECGEPLAEGVQFCPSCGHEVSEAAAPPIQRKEPIVAAEFTTEQVKALLTTEQAEKLDSSKESYTAEELKALQQETPAPTEAAPATALIEGLAALAGLKVEKAEPEKRKKTREEKLADARALLAEEEAAASSKPVTAEQLKEMLEAERKATVEAAMHAVGAANFRVSPFRKGLVPEGSIGNPQGGETADRATAEELREASPEQFRSHLAATLVRNANATSAGRL